MADLKHSRAYRILLLIAYFDQGYALTSYIKWAIAILGLTIQDLNLILWIGSLYIVLCFAVGWAWYHYKIINIQTEISNQYNPFVKEMREKI